jgi:hypothetical protein
MPSTYTTNGGIELPANGEQSGTWGETVNDNMAIIDRLTNGVGAISLSGTTHTLTTADGTLSDGQYNVLVLGGSPSGTNTITISPNDGEHVYVVKNASGQTATFTQGSGANVSVINNTTKIIYADGAGAGAAVVDITGALDLGSLIIAGTTTITAVLDEDNMASDSATALATQQSIKAYVDAQVGTVDTLAEILAIGNTTGATDIAVDSAQKVQFRDAAIYINSSVDGQLDIVADTEIQIAATTVDLNGALDVSGTLGVTGVLTATSLDISGDIDVDGTTNLDVVDIDGATQIDATVTVGIDDTGYDVKFFGATAGAYMLWDESADDLILGGAAGLSVNSTALVTGVLTTTAATVFNGGFAANAASTITTADNGVQLNLISTDSGSLNGPRFVMQRTGSAASSGDLLGRMEFYGSDDGGNATEYARIGVNAFDATGGSEDGAYFVSTRINNVTTNRMYMPPSETVFNDESADVDFRVESDTDANALFVEGSSGNVGIGTTTSLSKLTALGTSSTVANGASTRNPVASFRGGNDNNRFEVYVDNSGATAIMGLGAYNSAGGNTDMAFYTGSTVAESMRIDSSGNVGIGTSSPAQSLDTTGKIRVRDGGNTTIPSIQMGASGVDGLSLPTTNNIAFITNSSEAMRINSSGNVGIGSTVTTARANVWGANIPTGAGIISAHGQLAVYSTSTYGANIGGTLSLGGDGGTYQNVTYATVSGRKENASVNNYDGYLAFAVSKDTLNTVAERMRIDSSGNVGIGTTSPIASLSVQRASAASSLSLRHTAGGNGYGYLVATTGTTTNDLVISSEFNGSATERMRIDSSGNVGIGTSSPTNRR